MIANTTLTVGQLTVSLMMSSLALFIDSVDMALDVIGYALNLFADWYGHQPGKNQTSRLKLEVASASFSIVCTFALSVWTNFDALKRIETGVDHDMELGAPMLGFATVGLIFNCGSLAWFHVQGIPTCSHGDHGELNLCAALLHLVGDTVRMIVTFGSGLYIVVSGSEDSGMIDAWCAIFVSTLSLALLVPVAHGLALTIQALCTAPSHKRVMPDDGV